MKTEQKSHWRKQMHSIWDLRDTDDLLKIWQRNNKEELTEEAFEVIREILIERMDNLPPQNIYPDPGSQGITKPIYRRFWPVIIFGITILFLIAILVADLPDPNFHVTRDETRSVLLTQSNHPTQLIYEDENVRITIGYDQFMDFASAKQQSTLYSKRTQQDIIMLDEHDEYIVAQALELGKASVFDKLHMRQVTRVHIRYYEYRCGPLCGRGTRSFYLPNVNIFNRTGTQFFEVLDWIS